MDSQKTLFFAFFLLAALPALAWAAMGALRENQAAPPLYITGGHDLFIEVEPIAPREREDTDASRP